MFHLPDECADNAVGILAWNLDEHDKSGLTLDQGGDVAVLSPGEEVALPVPWILPGPLPRQAAV